MSTRPWHDPALPLSDRVTAALTALTAEQLTALALADYTVLQDLGLPPLAYRDGPSGVRDIPAGTAMPVTLALAATMDADLAHAYGAAIGAEVRGSGHTVLLGPALDLVRTPLAGRIPETMGEDPWLAGHLGAAYVRGVQSQQVIAMVKHLVANTHERGRTGDGHISDRGDALDVRVDERTLHELYLAPFRHALTDGGAWAVMASYNRLNGTYPSHDPDLWHLVKHQWDWKGFTAPDFIFAVRDPAQAVRAGLDVPGLDGPSGRTADMLTDPQRLRDIATRILTAVIGCGQADNHRQPAPDPATHDRLATHVAAEASVLLTNDGVLPLPTDLTEIAVIGCAGTDAIYTVGGSGGVTADPDRIITPLLGIRARAADSTRVTHAQGTLGDLPLPTLAAEVLTQPDGSLGVLAEYFTVDGSPICAAVEAGIDRHGPPDGVGGAFRARYTAWLTPRRTGRHRFSLTGGGHATLHLDGAQATAGAHETDRMFAGPAYSRQAVVDLTAGHPVQLEVRFDHGPALDLPFLGIRPGVRLGWQEPDDLIADAAEAATRADVAIVVAQAVSGEAMDRQNLALPGDQDDLIAAVATANPRTVVVLNTPGPVLMPWLAQVAAVVQVWYPGQRFGDALAAVLFGDTEPGGRLPVTFPADAQGPISTPEQMPGVDGTAVHSEGPLTGYRHFDHHRRQPLFPFGHGLSYTDFRYDAIRVTTNNHTLAATVTVTNTGTRAGTETVQLYVTAPNAARQPYRQLKGVAKLRLEPGATASATIAVPLRDLAAYHPGSGWQLHPGFYQVQVGRSSIDLRLRTDYDLDTPADNPEGQHP
ncbi:glycoside hydrolase family 3 protein [Catellatospora vulcania]|uniref:glycoside hydrolase family 3 protein n=1 Tax=Catellatospora vulcania TaxID=1460450 RepID=UPI0012D3DE18|nr:glycoside hydrolase family 3 C-terminal domain-containing protein [Catellatospora vulcania]